MGNHKESYLAEITALLTKCMLACLRPSSWGLSNSDGRRLQAACALPPLHPHKSLGN